MRQVDLRLLPWLGLLYAISLIDRTNLGIARIAGMEKALRLDIGERFSIASLVYFIPYVLFQLPSNILLKHVGARIWLTVCVVGWGVAQLGMGFVTNWGLLCLCRVFLGLFEAGFFPALVWIITTWYTRHEIQKRLAAFYLISIILGGFSAIFAYALTLLAGRGNLGGWQWIFIIEGIITIVLGLLTYVFVTDFPQKNTFLAEEQTKLVLARVEADRGDSVPDAMSLAKLLEAIRDPLIWAHAFMFMCATMPAYALSFFITIILRSMGWSIRDTFLLSAPPFVFAALSTFAFAWVSDRTKQRALSIVSQTLICITGLFVVCYHKSNPIRYFGLYLVCAGSAGCIPAILAYNANNVVGQTKRAVSSAIIIAFGGIGGIIAVTVYRQADFPRYFNGIWATIGCQFALLLLTSVCTLVYSRRNKSGEVLEGQPGFKYTL